MAGEFVSVVGHSEALDSSEAAAEVIGECRARLDGKPAHAGLLYAWQHDYEVLVKAVAEAFPGIQLMGASTDGELSSAVGYAESSVVLQIFSSDVIEIRGVLIEDAGAAGDDLGNLVAEKVREAVAAMGSAPTLCLTLPASLTVSGSAVVRGLRGVLGETFAIYGGTSGDGMEIQRTYEMFGDRVFTDSIPILLFAGPVIHGHGRASGWEPIGQAGTVTRATHNVIHEIDDAPATEYLRRYMGAHVEIAASYAEYPLRVEVPDGEFQIVILAVTDDGSAVLMGEVPTGASVRFAEADRDMIVAATRESVLQARAAYEGEEPGAAVIFSCAARKVVLGTRVGEEATLVSEALPSVPMAGFYSYGEISPAAGESVAHFNNEMFVTVLIGAR